MSYPPTPPKAYSPWFATGIGTLIAFLMDLVAGIVAVIVVVVAFFSFDYDLDRIEAILSDPTLTGEETIDQLGDALPDGFISGFGLALAGALLLLFVVWAASIVVVGAYLRRKGAPRAYLASLVGALVNAFVVLVGGLFVGPFVAPVSFGLQWVTMGLLTGGGSSTTPPPTYGQPLYGQPLYGQPQYGQPPQAQPPYGQQPYPPQQYPPQQPYGDQPQP